MDALTIREKLYDYIRFADDEKVEAMYTLIQDEADHHYEWWKDDDLGAELERRSEALRTGEDKGTSWEDVKHKLLSRIK